MRRSMKAKLLAPGAILRKSALTAAAAGRRGFPAWIDASERIVAFPAVSVTPRVRDGLVLRPVAKGKATKSKGPINGNRAR